LGKKSKIGAHRPRRPPLLKVLRVLDDDVFIKLEQAMNPATLTDELRNRLSSQIFDYFASCQRLPPRQAIVRERLVSITKAARKLHREINENPTTVEARAQMSRILKNQKGGRVDRKIINELQKQLDRFPDRSSKTDQTDERDVLQRINSLVQRISGVDLSELSEVLDRLCSAAESAQKSKGGRPAYKSWNKLMLGLAGIYEDATGKPATVTENEYKAVADERYSGTFVRVATIIDFETATGMSFMGLKPRRNSAIGPALQRVLKSRSPSNRKTH
jgi:hypothetical protein